MRAARPLLFGLLALAAACVHRTGAEPSALAPPPPPAPRRDSLAIHVEYPPFEDTGLVRRARDAIQSHDSTFLFGSVGRGDATLTVNGDTVPVYPTGGWIAWVPLPADTIARFDLVASAGTLRDSLDFLAPIAPRFVPPDSGAWVDTTSLTPTGDRWVRPGEAVPMSVRATPGATVQLVLADSTVIRFLPASGPDTLSWGARAFATTPPPVPLRHRDRYVASWRGPLGPDPGPVMQPEPTTAPDSAAAGWAVLEVIAGTDTVRHRWPLRLGVVDPRHPTVVVVNDDTAHTGTTDSTLAGRAAPHAVYNWFFPNGTEAVVSGRWNDQVRLQLSRESVAWVDGVDVQPLPPGTPAPRGRMLSPRLLTDSGSVTLRLPLPAHVPFRIDETDRTITLTLYGIAVDADWIQYGGTDPLVGLISFAQPDEDEATVSVRLTQPVWGYRTRRVGGDLLLEIRRPPPIDPRHPLRGRTIALDPGHPPGGAHGPTGVYEANVTLAVAKRARAMFERAGAHVVLLRSNAEPVSLVARTRGAERANADVLVSIHANALPDGVNPFVNNGTSVYYYRPRSAPLARAVDRALVRQFGFRDLGMGRGDLALARPTWMPAILCEGLFLMLPDQEAVLDSEEGQTRYARGIVDGVRTFLRRRAQ